MRSLAVFVFLTAAAAAFGGQFMPGAWYDALNKPAWTPPSWLFGPVWTALYVMIAIGGWRLWQRRDRRAVAVWGVQMVLNALWSPLFFGLKRPGLAFAEIVLMWLSIVALVVVAGRTRWWFVPYLVWVSFAAALNFAIWQMN